jgi:MFS family permease
VFGGASVASGNMATLLVLRIFAGIFGASTIVNSAGVISDIFAASERGLAVMVYCSAPFLGPTLGPLASGFLSQHAGWRWADAMTVIFTGFVWLLTAVFVPETYAPHLLIVRAHELSRITGKVYKSKLELEKGPKKASGIFKTTLSRPWIMFVKEPIVLLMSIYVAIVYGILYLTFSAFPIVFRSERHWSQGVSGLSFLGIMVGQILAMFCYAFLDRRYKRIIAVKGWAPPEARLEPALIGCIFLPIGLFWFAFTTSPSIHWIVSLIGAGFFGFGQVLLFISVMNYLIDAYTVYAASAIAANSVLRAIFGAVL